MANKKDKIIDIASVLDLKIPAIEKNRQFEYICHLLKKHPKVEIFKNKIGEKGYILFFTFEVGGVTYYFKLDEAPPENQLFACEVASDANIPCVDYKLAHIGNFLGVVSENFKKPDCDYILGSDLLIYANLESVRNYDRKKLQSFLSAKNSLDEIWFALERRYETLENKQEIVKHLMERIVDIFIHDIFLGESDRHSMNWTIEESDSGQIDVVPIYDTNRIFYREPEDTRVNLFVEIRDLTSPLKEAKFLRENISRFISISSEEYKNRLIERLWILKDENVCKIIKRIEEKSGIRFGPNRIIQWRIFCQKQLQFILGALGLQKLPEIKQVDFTTAINWKKLKLSNISPLAISYIQNGNVTHAVSIDGTINNHQQIFLKLVRRLNMNLDDDKQSEGILIKYYLNSDDLYASLTLTPSIKKTDYIILKSIIEELLKNNFTVTATYDSDMVFSDYPITFQNENILKFYESVNNIFDSDLIDDSLTRTSSSPKI